MTKKIFCYQHNIERYDADANDLSLIQHGAYRRILDAYYKSGAELPSDLKLINRIISCQSKAERDAVAYAVARFFTVGEDGFLRQNGAEKELQRILKVSEEQRRKANLLHSKNKHLKDAVAEPQHMPEACQLSTINYQLSIRKKERKDKEDFSVIDLPDWLPRENWVNFCNHRKSIKKPLTSKAANLILIELGKIKDKGQSPIESINKSIMNGWAGVFENKNGSLSGQKQEAKKTYSQTVMAAMEKANQSFEGNQNDEVY